MDEFIFDSYLVDNTKGLLKFNYIVKKRDREIFFQEQIHLGKSLNGNVNALLQQELLLMLHIGLGISYWKLYCIKNITIKTGVLNKSQAEFFNKVYKKGLGEFFYKNKIDYKNLVSFPFIKNKEHFFINNTITQTEKFLLGLGGGKDSIVAYSVLKKQKKSFDLFVIETNKSYDVVSNVAQKINMPIVKIKRILDSKILNGHQFLGSFDGHIPISFIYGILGIFYSIIFGYRGFLTGNEESAKYGNVSYLGEMVNHQWSKSLEFEKMFNDYIQKYLVKGQKYASVIMGFSELEICKIFSKETEFFNIFSSCNRNFSITKENQSLWCGSCPKCIFVYIMLGVFIDKNTLFSIFKSNILNNISNLNTVKRLLGVFEFKPFECVGTPEEVKSALLFYKKNNLYRSDAIIKHLIENKMI